MTPEAKVKRLIKLVLDKYKSSIYYYMPVPMGYGGGTLDYLGFCAGSGFAIEAKRPGQRPSPRQEVTLERIRASGARTFVIDGTEATDTITDLDNWFAATTNRKGH